METSIFEIIGPIMIGPSSSHTAGAARIARLASLLVEKPFCHVTFGLHGSFARTYLGHGTDRALIGGVLGIREDDERLRDAYSIGEKSGKTFSFCDTYIGRAHDNTVKITFDLMDGSSFEVIGSSIGGGQILIASINGFETQLTGNAPTLVIFQHDKQGVIHEVSRILANKGINIATMWVARKQKGRLASCIVEVDGCLSDQLVDSIKKVPNVMSAVAINR